MLKKEADHTNEIIDPVNNPDKGNVFVKKLPSMSPGAMKELARSYQEAVREGINTRKILFLMETI